MNEDKVDANGKEMKKITEKKLCQYDFFFNEKTENKDSQ